MMTFPIEALRPNAVSFVPNARTTSGSASLSGASQVVGSAMGLWEAKLVAVQLKDAETVRLWEAIEIALEGRLNPILIPTMEGRRQPFPSMQPAPFAPIPFDDGALFDDGSGFYEPVIDAVLAAVLARGATQAQINVRYGSELRPADFFSIGPRLYRIKSVEATVGTVATVKFWPRAREAAAAGAAVEFDRPVCKMRLKSDTGMAADKDFTRFSQPSVEFVEDLS